MLHVFAPSITLGTRTSFTHDDISIKLLKLYMNTVVRAVSDQGELRQELSRVQKQTSIPEQVIATIVVSRATAKEDATSQFTITKGRCTV